MLTHSDTAECDFEEVRWAARTQGAEGDVVHAKVLRPRHDVRIGVQATDQLARNYA